MKAWTRLHLQKQPWKSPFPLPLRFSCTSTRAGLFKGPDALDWQNLLGPSKNLDKICHCQIFNLSSVCALRHSKIFVNHKCQSHENKHHRLCAVRWKGYMRSQESWAYGDLAPLRSNMLPRILVFFFLEMNSFHFNSSRGSCYFIFTVWLPCKYQIIFVGFGLKYSK